MMILTLSPFCKPPSTCWILIEIALIEITLLHCLSYATTVAANVTTVAANTTNVAADATNVAANATTVAANATNVAANVTNVAADATPHEVIASEPPEHTDHVNESTKAENTQTPENPNIPSLQIGGNKKRKPRIPKRKNSRASLETTEAGSSAVIESNEFQTTSIPGEHDGKRTKFPFYVEIIGASIKDCAGAIVTDHEVVTSAQCIWNSSSEKWIESSQLQVRTVGGKGQIYSVRKVLIHGIDWVVNGGEANKGFDIVVMNTSAPMTDGQDGKIIPVCSDTYKHKQAQTKVIGRKNGRMQGAKVEKASLGGCDKFKMQKPAGSFFCGSQQQGEPNCTGRIGSPLFVVKNGAAKCLYGFVSLGSRSSCLTSSNESTVFIYAPYYLSRSNSTTELKSPKPPKKPKPPRSFVIGQGISEIIAFCVMIISTT